MTETDVVAAVGAYLLGAVPMAQLLVRWFARKDLSASGSSNVGALNAMRVSKSKGLGAAVLVLDALKGVAAVYFARMYGAHPGYGLAGVVAGHNYNLWLSIAARRLVGGKGFAAAAGALLCFMPWLVAIWFAALLIAWFVFKAWKGITDEAPASLVATVAIVPAAYGLYDVGGTIAMAVTLLLILPKLVREWRELVLAERATTDA